MITKSDLNLVLVKASGTALVTLAVIRLPDVFKSLMGLISASWARQFMTNDSDFDRLITKYNDFFITNGLGDLVAFVVLLLLARWMFGYPQIMRTAFARAERNEISEVPKSD